MDSFYEIHKCNKINWTENDFAIYVYFNFIRLMIT